MRVVEVARIELASRKRINTPSTYDSLFFFSLNSLNKQNQIQPVDLISKSRVSTPQNFTSHKLTTNQNLWAILECRAAFKLSCDCCVSSYKIIFCIYFFPIFNVVWATHMLISTTSVSLSKPCHPQVFSKIITH